MPDQFFRHLLKPFRDFDVRSLVVVGALSDVVKLQQFGRSGRHAQQSHVLAVVCRRSEQIGVVGAKLQPPVVAAERHSSSHCSPHSVWSRRLVLRSLTSARRSLVGNRLETLPSEFAQLTALTTLCVSLLAVVAVDPDLLLQDAQLQRARCVSDGAGRPDAPHAPVSAAFADYRRFLTLCAAL